MEKLKKFLAVKSNWAYVIMFFVLVVAYIVGLFNERFSYIAIGGLFLFIALESFIKSIGYFEDIKDNTNVSVESLKEIKEKAEMITKSISKIDEMAIQISKVDYSYSSCIYKDVIPRATNSLFFSGVGMAFFDYDIENSIIKVDQSVNITFVVMNVYNEDVATGVESFYNISKEETRMLHESFIKRVLRINNFRKTNFGVIDTFVQVSYFAVDYKELTEFSFIQAKYYLLTKNDEHIDVMYYTARPGTELFKCFRKQILIIEDKAKWKDMPSAQ